MDLGCSKPTQSQSSPIAKMSPDPFEGEIGIKLVGASAIKLCHNKKL